MHNGVRTSRFSGALCVIFLFSVRVTRCKSNKLRRRTRTGMRRSSWWKRKPVTCHVNALGRSRALAVWSVNSTRRPDTRAKPPDVSVKDRHSPVLFAHASCFYFIFISENRRTARITGYRGTIVQTFDVHLTHSVTDRNSNCIHRNDITCTSKYLQHVFEVGKAHVIYRSKSLHYL